ncbi:Dystonin, partial [Tupaia chinensis]
DERDKVQKKTFTKWINQHLMKVRKHVNDLYEDLRDGHNLISLLEVLSGDTLPRERGRMRFHRLQNVQIALDYLKRRQISDIHVTGESEDMSAKERLLLWTQQATEGYAGIRCENFTTCWRDGKLFNAIIHKYRPDLIDMNTVAVQSNLANLEHAFYVAEKIGVIRLLDPEDVDVSSPDEKSVITYVSSLYDAFPKVPEGGEGISANDVEVKWIEYQNMVNYLIQWIRHHVTTMSERTFPNNPVELKALYNQYLQFKETEIPPKETEKSKIKRLYKLLEIWIEFGRIKLLQGYHPNDIEKEWGKLIIAMLEREKALRPEVERLDMLQQIANRVQRGSIICEDKLILARNALQSDTKRLESGVQFQNEAEIAGYILECENLLRQHVIDVQILVDGKYYQADQLVQRVAKLRDEIMAFRNECSSVYSKGRVLTTEQTKLMISGITQSLNSGFAQTLNPSLNSGLTQSLTPSLTPSSVTSGLSSGMTSRLTPSVTPAYTPGFPSSLLPNFSSGVEPNSLQTLKLMQIRKPLLKSSLLDQNLTEEEVNMKFVQDLLNWVDEMQVQLDRTEWGSDLPSVESHLENHKNVHRAIEEFESSLKEAKLSEIQMTAPLKLTYAEKLHRLESQYAKLLNTSRNQERHLDTLHNFVTRATNELIWLNEKEEEEVAYDWSERNTHIARKKDYHAELMRELDQKEENIKSVQEIAEQLLLENHPARLTIEAYRAAMQTQWSWILQLCQCVEQHIKENTAYFEFFNDAKEATDYLRNLKDAIQRKYSCDRSSSIHKLEDLVQESMEEKEELLQYKSKVASLMGRAKSIIQLKPRNPECPLKTSIPIKAICDYRQIEITIYKDDECVLANNSHRAKWKVISPTGNEAMVPSVCFTVPPPNKEAVDFANRIEQQYQNVLTLWHESHINMKSVVSWHYLVNEIDRIRASNVASIKTMLPGEHQQVLSNLQSRFEDFLEDSQESQVFSGADITQLEKEVNVCKQYYQELLKSAEREEQEESVYNLYISEVRNIRLRLENCEDRLIRQIRTPLERDDLHESVFRITEQEKLKKELERLKDDLGTITNKCEEFFSQAASSPSVPTLRSELNVVVQNMNQVYSMSSTYIDKLKTINLVLKNTQAAEALVKLYETKLCEEEAVIADKNNIENLISTLKQWRSEVDEKREVFHALEDELQKAKAISDEMFKTYKERDLDFDWHKEKADQLVERWQNVHVQIDNRLRDLEGIGKSLKYYRDTYHPLDDWIQQVETTQKKIQENQPENSKSLATQLNQQKMLVSEIEMRQSKMDECQKYAEQYSATVKDYELQTMTYRAMVDSQQKSPVKRRRMQSSADVIIQEFMDLKTRYTALVTLMTQYIKFAGDSLKRLEEEEKSLEEEKKEHVEKAKELQKWVSNISTALRDGEKAGKSPFSKQKISSEEVSTKKDQLSEALQTMQLFLAKHGDKMTDEERNELEKQVKTLQEGYNLLFSESLKQVQETQTPGDTKVEEKLDKVIAGTIDQTTGEVLSVFQAVLRGLIDYDTGIRLLETQLMISGLISPELRKCFDLKDAESHGLIDEQILCQLKELNKAKEIISAVSSTTIPVLDALAQGVVSESTAIRILEILLSTGFLVIPDTGEQVTLQKAFQQNLVSSALFSKVLERQNMCKDLIDPYTSEKVSLTDMVQRSILQENTGMWLLPVRPQEGGRITLKCGRNISILRAAHEGLIDRETMFRLLGAQLLSGGLIDCNSGQRMTIEEAMAEGMIDRDTASSILTYQVQTGGIIRSNPAKRLTVDEAVQCDLITSSSALLVLEAQRGYVGLIWPHSGEIFPTSSSLQQELITNELAYKILNGRQKIAALYIPESSEVIDLDVAKQLGIIDNNTALILKNIMLPDKMPDLGDLEACKNARRWLSFCKFQPSTVHDYRQEEDVFDGDEPVATQSSEQTKKLFLSYLMINSYMDANTGQRLLLYDGDLAEAVGMLLEGCTTECDEDTAREECLPVFPDVFLSNVPGKEKDKWTGSPVSSDKCHCRETEHKETPENRKGAINEEFHERGNNVISSEFCQSENLANTISIDEKVSSSSSVCVPSPLSYLEQTNLTDVNTPGHDSENIIKNYKNQSQVDTNEHVDECSYFESIQNFASDLITNPIVKSKTSKFCNLNETENDSDISKDSSIFDYSPRLSALLSHDKLRHSQGSFHEQNNGNKCEDSALSLNDQTVLSGQRMEEKFQDQFLGIAAINISLPGEHAGQKSLNVGCGNSQLQYNNDRYVSDTADEVEKLHTASQQKHKKSESEMEAYPSAVTSRGDIDNANTSHICDIPVLEEAVSAGDYETSLLDDQHSDTGTDTDSDDDFYDTPLFEDDDHDSLLLEGDESDCLQPEDYDILQEENDGPALPAVNEKENSDKIQNIGQMIFLDKMHSSSLEEQQSTHVLQLDLTSRTSLVTKGSNSSEYTTEITRKSKENLLNSEMALKNVVLPIVKDTESEKSFDSVDILHNNSITTTSELDNNLRNTKAKVIQGPESVDSVKGGGQYFENVTPRINSSSDKSMCSEPDLIEKPAVEGCLPSIADKAEGNGRDLSKGRNGKDNIPEEDETSIQKMCLGKEVLIEGLVEEESKYLELLPSKSARESLNLGNSLFSFPQITNVEELNHQGSFQKATVTLKTEPTNLQTMVSRSPVQFENLEEIFDTSVSKVIVTTDIEKDVFTEGPQKELDLFAHLQHCAKSIKTEVPKPNEDIPGCISVATPLKQHLQLGVSNTKEKSAHTQQDSTLNETVQQNDLCSKESVFKGETKISQFTPESNETTLVILPLKNEEDLGKNTDFVQSEPCTNRIRNDNCTNTSNTDRFVLEIDSKKERIERQSQKEQTLSPTPQEKEVQHLELSQEFAEDVKEILKSRLKEGHMNPQEIEEPFACEDTKILLQNLFKSIGTSQLVNEFSNMPKDSETSDSTGVSSVSNLTELKAEKREGPLCVASLKSELLLDILKQNQHSQNITGAFELMRELTRIEYYLEKRAITSEVLPLQLENIFYKLLADGCSGKVEQVGDSNEKACTTSEMEEKPHIPGDLKSRKGSHCSLHVQTVEEIGLENSTVCASALPREEKLQELCDDFSNPLDGILGSKEVTHVDHSTEQFSSELQQCSQHTEKMHEYLTLLRDMKPPLDNQESLDNNLEALKKQLKQLEAFELGLAPIAVILRKDMKLAEEFLKSLPSDFPRGHLEELQISHQSLQTAFSSLSNVSSERRTQIMLAIDSEMSKLTVSHEEFLHKLTSFSGWISEKSKSVKDVEIMNVDDAERVKKSLEFLKNVLKDLGHTKMQLETTAFDVQFFISEYAQDLAPNQSKQLLRLLNTTQKGFLDVQESITTQVERLEAQLQLEQDLDDQKIVAERQQEYKEKLQGICDVLTQTENRLIGHQEAFVIGDGTVELKKYQSKQEELQKDMQGSAKALAEIVKNTENFLKENGEKLSQEDKALIEQKLNEAKMKCEQLNLKAEQSKKELDKVVTTAIKEETEKVAAVKQLEENRTKIENLLDWLSNMDKDSETAGMKHKQVIEQNGTHFQEGDGKSAIGEEDEMNGNLLETDVDGQVGTTEENLNQQYEKVKAQHEKIVSQHQAVIIATQSAQALLEKQGHYLSHEEKEKLQKNMKELKAHYETALAESEKKMKLTHSLWEELEKFDADYSEFEHWLQQSEQELENLEAGADDFTGLMTKLKRQKSFSEDVISHKGDLRYITISGNRVLEAAKSCSKRDGGKANKDNIDTSATHREVQSKLDHASDRFRSLYTKCNVLGNNLKDLVDKYQHYEDASCGLLSGLQACEATASKHLSEAIAVDPKNLQRQLEETKALQGQISSQQAAVEKLKKTAEVLLDARGSLLPAKNDIQKTLDDIVGRYDDLSKSVNERNEKLQITLTRSLSVQDGLDEMLDWMGSVESSLKEEQGQMPLNSTALQDIISKNIMLEQDIAGRQSSINAMNEKVKKFIETTDPSTASSLQAKMKDLSVRFSEASHKHKEKLAKIEELKTKVELFENLSEKLQTFLETKTQALTEADVPGKDVTELSQYMQESSSEFLEHKKDLEVLHSLLKEISSHGLPGDKALVFEKTNNLLKKFKEMEDTIKEKKEAVISCQEQLDAFQVLVKSLKSWIKETTESVPIVQPSFGAEDLGKALEETKKLQEKWSLKTPEIQKVKNSGISLCNLVSAVTTPAKAIAAVKSALTSIIKEMTDINHGYEDLGLLLKDKIAELNAKLSKLQKAQEESSAMMQWLQKMNTTATKWHQTPTPTDAEAVKVQVEQNKSFEAELKQNVNKVQELKDKLTELLEENPDTPEAPKWKQMLTEIDSKWKELNQLTVDRQQKLEESSNNLTQFQTVEAQLKQWLVEKELMVSVLGPLSIDPNMLNTQRQQVQILLQEFDTRKPQYEQLTASGQGILSRPGEDPSLHKIVKEQLAAVTQKWDSLTGQLSDRCDWIGQAIVKSTQYQSLLRSLSDKLGDLDNKLSSSLAVSTHPDAMDQQLETAQKMKQEIEQERKQIKVAQALCEDLSALVKEEYLKAELSRQLEGVLKSFKDIEQKSENHIQHLQSACASSHQFRQMSRDFQAWFDSKKEEQSKSPPISAKLDVLESLIKDQKDFSTTLTAQSDIYEKTIAEGENLLLKTQGSEKAALQSQLNTIKTNWDGFNKQVKEREDKLKESLEKALKYREQVETLKPWIDKCQNNLEEIKFCLVAKLKSLQKEMDQHFGMVELLNNTANSLLSVCEIDKEVVTDENKSLIQKVDMVTEQLHSKKLSLDNMAQKFKEFQEISKEAKRQLQCAKEQLDVHDSLGPQAHSNKYLTMLQSQQKSLQTLKHQVDLAKTLAQDLVVGASDSKGTCDVLLQAENLAQEHSTLSQQVDEKCSFLETKLQGIGHFQNTIREMFAQFAEFDDELDSMAPVGRDVETLQKQKEDMKAFLKKLEALIASNDSTNKTCRMMLATEETSPDLIGIKRDLEALSKQCNKLLDRAQAREEQVGGMIERLEVFYSKLKEFSTLLQKAEEHEESQGPVAMETEIINQQLDVFKRSIYDTVRLNEQIDSGSKGSLSSRHFTDRTLPYSHRTLDVSSLCSNGALTSSSVFELRGRETNKLDEKMIFDALKLNSDIIRTTGLPKAKSHAEKKEHRRSWRMFVPANFMDYANKSESSFVEPTDMSDAVTKASKSRWGTNSLTSEEDSGLCSPPAEREEKQGILTGDQSQIRSLSSAEDLHVTEPYRPFFSVNSISEQKIPLLSCKSAHPDENFKMSVHDSPLEETTCVNDWREIHGENGCLQKDLRESSVKCDPFSMPRHGEEEGLSNVGGQEKTCVPGGESQSVAQRRRLTEDTSQDLDLSHIDLGETDVDCGSMSLVENMALLTQCDSEKSSIASKEEVEAPLSTQDMEVIHKKCSLKSTPVTKKATPQKTEAKAGVLDTLCNGLQSAQVFQKEEIEPLQVKQQDVNWLGQGLIQSAAKSTSTQGLEQDLDDVNARWKTLNKKVAQRAAQLQEALLHCGRFQDALESLLSWMVDTEELVANQKPPSAEFKVVKAQIQEQKVAQRAAQLQEALLHCGRFQDALESLLSWMVDTEELVANQKPPSAEFKVVKAQIQEQKLLQRLLDDRKSTVEVIKREGEKIAATAELADKVKILKQLNLLDSRWEALLNKAETRNRQLEGISVVAQQFHETLEPLNEWLTTIEKRLANCEPIGTQAAKLEEQITQHKALEDDIINHNKHLHQAVSIGQSLKVLSSREDKDMVQNKLDFSQVWYIEIQEKCHSRSELLQQALCNAKIFGEDEVELMNWLNEVHDKLSKLSVQDYSTEGLWKQQSELRVLQEDILLRKQNVDQALQNGLELLKQTTGDEVLIIQDKLEAIKARYKDITKLSTDVAQTLEQALQLARRLHCTHEELCTWLDKVELELLSYETQVLRGEAASQAHVRQKELKKEVKNNKTLVDSLNEVSSALLELVPWRAREGLEKMVAEDNERYHLVSDTITQKVEEIDAAILRSQQFDQAADAELSWITETEKKLMSLGDIRLEQDQTSAQLQVQKTFTMEILRHKDIIDELVKSGHKVMTTCSEEEKQSMKKKLDKVLKNYDAICQINSERYLQLERAQSLVSQFWETYEELWPWLTDTQRIISELPAPALEYETLRQQQEEHRQLRELIAEHKPHIDKMNKTGPQLLELSPGEGFSIQEKYVAADTLYSQIKEDVKKRAVALDEAISQSTQFHDKIDQILESLERIVERLRQPPSISAEVEKIKEQISENKNVSVDMEKLQPLYETLKQRGEEMIARSGGTDKDISAKAVQDKLDQMVFIWENIHTLVEEREAKLLDVMELAEKFWCDHMSLVVTIKDTQDFIRDLEDPGIDPSVVKQQQEAAEAIREEIDGLQEELDVVINLGSELIAACGEPDKPIVKKSIDELNSAWDSLNKAWKDRVDNLEEAMQAAVQYQDGLQAIFDWVDITGSKLASMSPIGTDLETVKQQIEELKQFKSEAYQQQIEMERLHHQAELLLKKVTEESDKHTVQDPFMELKLIWDSLDERIINRQHKLEGALLALGQFQHALDELLKWLTHTEGLLSEQKSVGGDPKAIEIELAKHHVLQNDVLAHQSTVEAVKKAGNDLIESSAGEEASNLQNKLEVLNQRWQNVLEKTEQRKQQLDGALRQAKGFHGEIEDLQQWLTDTERQLLASKPLGGLPETAKEQLNAHMEVCAAFDVKEETYKSLMQKGQQMLARCPESAETNIDQDINNLKEKWESVETKLNERKAKLEEALNLAMEFHNSLQDFINWLTQAEQTLNLASRPSLILDTVLFQIDEHKVFANEVNSHREQIIELDKTGTHLKYFSQKQDVVLIKNLLISVQSRWEKVVQRLVERGRSLDDARKRAKQFHEAWTKLMEWLEESEKSLDSELEIANDPDKIKTQLAQHKEFQKSLGAKHSVYDTTNRTGRSLKEKTSLADDNLKLDNMLSELRDKWDTICGKSVERQNKLEEALLFSGQFTDALQALIDWLYRVEPQLAEDQPVHGDIDLVMNLIDNHKAFQKELGKRTSSVQALKRSARELIEGSRDDSSWVKVQMQELSTRWETVCALSISKQTRLEAALRQAEEFHSVVHALLEWLAEAEQTLRFHGVLPDDEDALRTLIDQHKEFMKKLEEKRAELNKATSMGDAVLAICHPDSITTIKHWITIIRARFEEVLAWAKQHQQRLASALAGLIAKQELLEALLAWLQWAETTLSDKDKEVIPQEIEEVKALIAEHQTFMEEMTRKQPDVDKVTKTYKRRAADPASLQSHIPVLDKGRAGRKRFPSSGLYPSGSQTQIETKNPRVNLLVSKWQQVWLLALERRRKLNDALDRLEELREFANFDFDIWRKKYMRWMNHKKSRVMDFFRRIDKDQDGKITRQEFIDGILSSKFPTSRLEMSAVADIFDRDGDGYIDYYEFVAALHPNKDAYKPVTDADKIEDEVTRQVAKCKCAKRFQVEQIGDNKYRFGDSQQLRLVRILRSTVMVRVGGGWMALDEFLVKNDPCRAKGRTNMELREKFILADGASQGMAAFRPRGRRSRPSSRGASPNRSTSLSSQAGQVASPQVPATSTPKGTPIQGSKLRLPGYLSGKGFHSGEDSGLITTAAARVRTQFADSKKTPSRPGSRAGSKAGSRASSRRGSDASDFDISEIQSVCSDVETVPQTYRPSPRAGSRPSTAKPSKIPTPQRKSPAKKLDKSSKR